MTGAGLWAPPPRELVGDEGSRVLDAMVRPLAGRDEEMLADADARGIDGSMASTVTALLARCVVSLSGAGPPSTDVLRSLSVGDREALLLHLRRATLGDRIDCVATCPDPACGERLDLTLSVAGLLVPRYDDAAAWHEEMFGPGSGRGSKRRVRFRLPTGGDQEATAEQAATDPAAAARALLARCVASSTGSGGVLADLPDDIADAVAARMAELDPQAEIRLRFDCAACGRPGEVLFDTASFFLAEIAATADRLYDEIHAIAWHYHWSEAEILDLPRSKRRRYLDLIASSLSARQSRGVA
ncbi:MAG TPA: hypothetical protein VFR14_13140 [Candidatus Limnocylindrales bacterium]|nr:hypothetical protein [Candidatus Limnocylindrales bacterium]